MSEGYCSRHRHYDILPQSSGDFDPDPHHRELNKLRIHPGKSWPSG